MTQQELENLKLGDIIENVPKGYCLIVTANFTDRVTAVRTVDITNPLEWELVKPIKNEKSIGKTWIHFMDRSAGRLLVIPLSQILEAFFYYVKEDYAKEEEVIWR